MNLDQCGFVLDGFGLLDGGADLVVAIVAVLDPDRMPAEGVKTGADVLCEGDLCVPVDGDVVVIIEGDQLPEPPVPGYGASFVRDALHLATISENDIPSSMEAQPN